MILILLLCPMKKHLHTGFGKTLITAMCMMIVFTSVSAFEINDNTRKEAVMVHTVKCYPNPAISFINFEFPSTYLNQKYTIGVYSFSGKKMFESNVSAARMTFNFNGDFFRGIYIYQLKDNSGRIVETGKFQVIQ